MKKMKAFFMTAVLTVGFTSVAGAASASTSTEPTYDTDKIVCTMPCNKEF